MKITNRSQMIYALTEVAELEHTLMCQYLFAAASLKSKVSELPNKDRCYHQIELTREWKKQLMIVAREEMQHLTFAINLLVSVGGSPTFSRPNFPTKNRFYKNENNGQGLLMCLEPFSKETISRFIQFEAPPVQADVAGFVPAPNTYDTLHEFYDNIKNSFTDDMFINTKDQYDPVSELGNIRVKGRKNINTKVTSVAEAKKLIDMIVEEGEGSTANDPNAHVIRFTKIKQQLLDEIEEDPDFEPSRPVLKNSMTRIHDDIDSDLISSIHVIDQTDDNGLPHNLLQFSSGSYEILLTWLYQVFAQHGSKEELTAIETLAFMPYMTEIFRPIMELMTQCTFTHQSKQVSVGPGFELTSNNFLIPKAEVIHQLTIERLTSLEILGDTIVSQLKQAKKNNELITDFEFVKKSISLIKDEFESRIKLGYKPEPDVESLSDLTYSEIPADDWGILGTPVLELKFQGWSQCRLGSDPDGMNERRGVTGNNFAIGDEGDLDQVIQFQKGPKTFQRSHCPDIGIKVTEARILTSPFDTKISDVPSLIDATIDLIDNPKFEGRNHVVSEDGEPIDPFVLLIRSADQKITMQRSALGSGELKEMSPIQRRGTGRFPNKLSLNPAASSEHLKRIKYDTAQKYIEDRIEKLKKDQQAISDPYSKEGSMINFRLNFMDITHRASKGENVRESIRWKRFFFNAFYRHTLSGKATISQNDVLPGFSFPDYEIVSDITSKWLIEYNFGFYDSDALSSHVYGSIRIPVILK